MPVGFPAHPCLDRVPLADAEFHQFPDPRLRLAPLFPVAHADAAAEPLIPLVGGVVPHSNTEIVHPPLYIGADFPVPVFHGNAPTAPGKAAQFVLAPREGLLRDGQPLVGEGEAEKGASLGSDHLALVPVDLHLELLFKESADAPHHALTGALRPHLYDEVIGVPAKLVSSFLQFLVEVIQKDITQKRR